MNRAQAPRISIITPVFNEERYLDRMIISLLRQSLVDWELVIVDDGSTDRTPEVAAKWAQKDRRITSILPGEKVGKVAAFNLAFSMTNGRHICHLGGDDALPPSSLEIRVGILETGPPKTVAFGKLQMIDENDRKVGRPVPRGVYGSQSGPGATFTRQLAEDLFPVPTELPAEDIWLGNAAVLVAHKVLHVDDVVTLYRMHGGNSNPRHRDFETMNEAIHARQVAIRLLAETDRFPLDPAQRRQLKQRWELEELRYHGETRAILRRPGTAIVDRLALSAMSKRSLWRIRQALGVKATGWRRR